MHDDGYHPYQLYCWLMMPCHISAIIGFLHVMMGLVHDEYSLLHAELILVHVDLLISGKRVYHDDVNCQLAVFHILSSVLRLCWCDMFSSQDKFLFVPLATIPWLYVLTGTDTCGLSSQLLYVAQLPYSHMWFTIHNFVVFELCHSQFLLRSIIITPLVESDIISSQYPPGWYFFLITVQANCYSALSPPTCDV